MIAPAAGRVGFAGGVTGLRPHRVARRGIACTFRIVQPFDRADLREAYPGP